MKTIIERIVDYLVDNQIIDDKQNAELHARRIYDLYVAVGRECLLDEDLEDTLDRDIEGDDLTLYNGLGYYAQGQYSPDDEWWWYVEMDGTAESVCKAISVRTGEILDEDEITLEFDPDIVPSFTIVINDDEFSGRNGEVSCPANPDRPWMTGMLNSIRATGTTDDEVIEKVITAIQQAFHREYRRPLSITPDDYDVESW